MRRGAPCCVPLTVTALILTIAYNPQFALLMSLSLTLATVITVGGRLSDLLVAMGGQATAVLILGNIRTRTRLVEVGGVAGLAYLAMTVATELYSGQAAPLIAWDAGRGLLWGLLSGFLVSGLLPLVEYCFTIITDVSLVELADGSHPLLQELVRRAPGTYTHSMTVATLAEPAAEAIGANPLLTRVGSYFHDIGKMLKPHYFIENQTGENRHDALEPALSTLIIIGHVKDGVCPGRAVPPAAADHRLHPPAPRHDARGVFLSPSAATAGGAGQRRRRWATASRTRWSRRSAIRGRNRRRARTASSCWPTRWRSSSRALSNPTPGSLRKLVRDMLMKRLLDGQFEECGLTLTELHVVEESLCKGLVALYHSRIKYPEAERKAS